MCLIKIGSTYLNLDQVTEVRDTGVDVEVFFGLSTATTLRGAEADALRRWLDQKATDLNPPAD